LFLLAVLSLIGAGTYGRFTRGDDSGLELLLPQLFPGAAAFELLDTQQGVRFIFGAVDDGSLPLGYVTSSQGQGYGGPMTVVMAWSPQGTVLDVRVTEHFEDLPWFDTLGDKYFFRQYIGLEYSQV
jgi:Na+-translocating ferredoxin:NAD+ oxidoreductase RnfG subunit